MPKVSVVIPSYNGARFLPEAIQSVLAQSFRDFELIIIDDGSTDSTPDIVSAFPVRYFRQENQGEPAARNRGIELSQGQYIAFLDADDVRLKNSLEKSVEVLDRHPEAAFSYGQAYWIDGKGSFTGFVDKAHPKYSCVRQGWEELRDLLLFGNHITVSTVMIRRSCLEKVGMFDPAFRSGSTDLDMWVRLAKRYAVGYIAEPLAKYRLHSQNFCSGRNLNEWEKTNGGIIESIFNDAELGPHFSNLRPKAHFRFYLGMADVACEQGHMMTARHFLFKGLKGHQKGLLSNLGPAWIKEFLKTWMPLPILASARSVKRRILTNLQRVCQDSAF